MAAAFAVILGAHMRGRREVRLKQEKLRHAAKSDGKYIAERLQPHVATAKGMHTTAVSGLVNFQRSQAIREPARVLETTVAHRQVLGCAFGNPFVIGYHVGTDWRGDRNKRRRNNVSDDFSF
jgi:hypothetical protein